MSLNIFVINSSTWELGVVTHCQECPRISLISFSQPCRARRPRDTSDSKTRRQFKQETSGYQGFSFSIHILLGHILLSTFWYLHRDLSWDRGSGGETLSKLQPPQLRRTVAFPRESRTVSFDFRCIFDWPGSIVSRFSTNASPSYRCIIPGSAGSLPSVFYPKQDQHSQISA